MVWTINLQIFSTQSSIHNLLRSRMTGSWRHSFHQEIRFKFSGFCMIAACKFSWAWREKWYVIWDRGQKKRKQAQFWIISFSCREQQQPRSQGLTASRASEKEKIHGAGGGETLGTTLEREPQATVVRLEGPNMISSKYEWKSLACWKIDWEWRMFFTEKKTLTKMFVISVNAPFHYCVQWVSWG